jgi:glycerophosphoryl diester phosphodiesterase
LILIFLGFLERHGYKKIRLRLEWRQGGYMKKLYVLALIIPVFASTISGTEIIAHRGFWNNYDGVQNSVDSFKKANNAGFYGSETDVYITPDDVVVISHDASLWGRVIEKTEWEKIKDVRLPNGEPLPYFEDYLRICKNSKSKTKLVLEIKPHEKYENDGRIIETVLDLVKKYKLESRVIYVSSRLNICKQIVRLAPEGTVVLYLKGDMSPSLLKKLGISGFDYIAQIVMLRPEWIKQAKKLGLITAVWNVNDKNKLKWCIDNKIDFITTDYPDLLRSLLDERKN